MSPGKREELGSLSAPTTLAHSDLPTRNLARGGCKVARCSMRYRPHPIGGGPRRSQASAEPEPRVGSAGCAAEIHRIAESAPGGNRTRGLRLERPLLFGSPRRTVDH